MDIARNHKQAAKEHYDIIIIGGGIYGIALSLVASQMGIKTLVLEKNDFGWSTSFNSLRTIHGGLRYLQSMDLKRFFESVNERRWFLQEFPGLVTPLSCLMPLYGNGAYKPSVFRIALALNDLLSKNRNKGVVQGQELSSGKVIRRDEVIRLFPQVDRNFLKGGAIWYDGGMPESQLVVMEMLKRSCKGQVTALNYTEVHNLIVENKRVQGVDAVDRESGELYTFSADNVINAAGPWCRKLAAEFDRDDPEIFRYSIAWNALINKPSLSPYSVAVKPRRPGARMFFIHAWNGLIMGGTVHSAWNDTGDFPMPDDQNISRFIDDMNLAIPSLDLKKNDIIQIYSGLLPVKEQGSDNLTKREVIKDHGAEGGPQGVYTVSGIKFTTARKVAEKMLRIIFPQKTPLSATSIRQIPAPSLSGLPSIFDFNWLPDQNEHNWKEKLTSIIGNEAVIHLDDLILRRTTIGDNPDRALKAAPEIARLFDWDEIRQEEEIERLQRYYDARRPS